MMMKMIELLLVRKATQLCKTQMKHKKKEEEKNTNTKIKQKMKDKQAGH